MAKKKSSRKAPSASPARPTDAKKPASRKKTAKKGPARKKATRKPAAKKASKKSPQKATQKSTKKKKATKKAAARKPATSRKATKEAAPRPAIAETNDVPSRVAADEAPPTPAAPPVLEEATPPPDDALEWIAVDDEPAPADAGDALAAALEEAFALEEPIAVDPAEADAEIAFEEGPVAETTLRSHEEPVEQPADPPAEQPVEALEFEDAATPTLTDELDGLDWFSGDEERAFAPAPAAKPGRVTAGSDDVLMTAAESGDIGVVRTMLDLGASPSAHDRRRATIGWTPLMLAAASDHAEVVALLVAAGADLDATDDPEGRYGPRVTALARTMTPDQIAAEGLPLGRTALHVATAYGRPAIARALVEGGCDPDLADHGGERPLMLAAQAGAHEIAQLLLERGVDADARDLRSGCGALERAAMMGRAPMIQRLFADGATVDVRDHERRTPLMYAVGGAHYDAARLLLENHADPRAEAASGFGVLCAAVCARGYFPEPDGSFAVRPFPEESILPVIELLLRWGADDSPDGTGVRPSQHADGLGHKSVVRVLAEYCGEDDLRRTA